ncbi:MAG: gamma-glutamyl-gamma-aminobutyrate hydrolase family protein [Microbacteriaceae bacterium]
MRTALAVVNQPSAHLGALDAALASRGFAVRTLPAAVGAFTAESSAADVVVLLGGDMGVYDTQEHPFLLDELDWLAERLAAGSPTLGVCLGAQLIAEALGGVGTVRRGPTPDVGFRELRLTEAGAAGALRHFAGVPVAEWHGDAFALPAGATLLASSEACAVEAFELGGFALGLQFHPEVTAPMWEAWLEESRDWLSAAGLDDAALRDAGRRRAGRMNAACDRLVHDWLLSLA